MRLSRALIAIADLRSRSPPIIPSSTPITMNSCLLPAPADHNEPAKVPSDEGMVTDKAAPAPALAQAVAGTRINLVSHVPPSVVTASSAAAYETSSLSSTGQGIDDDSSSSSWSSRLPIKKRKAREELRHVLLQTYRQTKKLRAVSESSGSSSLFLLGHPSDAQCLSPLHAFIRQQIEVFTATPAEQREPAPGRKCPIQLRQVGLRCIHCRSSPRRVKRAVCYPTSIARVYHSVSDMKGEHFTQCPSLPEDVRATVLALKSQESRRKPVSLLMAQHYKMTAYDMGLRDSDKGAVFLQSDLNLIKDSASSVDSAAPRRPPPQQHRQLPTSKASFIGTAPRLSSTTTAADVPLAHSVSFESFVPGQGVPGPVSAHEHCRILALDQDPRHLNDIHCWVRRHIEAFAATEHDIAVPAPGRKQRILLGQVGLRCVHCVDSPRRVKRAVCYPPSISGIYHAVSNMKFDHYKHCPCLPAAARVEFEALVEATRSKESVGKGTSNSTARYYQVAALDLGLVDTEYGIRFQASPKPMEASSAKQSPTVASIDDSMDGISALVVAATNPELQAAYAMRKQSASSVVC